MIEIQAKIHDKYSVEFKVGFVVGETLRESDFVMNTWIFIPNSLDINALTYQKYKFYRDIKSNIRLITPVYNLQELTRPDCLPMKKLRDSCESMVQDPDKEHILEYESQIKMFASILKSSLRDEVIYIRDQPDLTQTPLLANHYLENSETVMREVRQLFNSIEKQRVSPELIELFQFGDEFISNVFEQHTYKLLQFLKVVHPGRFPDLEERIIVRLKQENEYKREKQYAVVDENSSSHNRDFVFRAGTLKKYIESDLFLTARKKKNTFMAEQVLFSLAAGISMIFATVIAFSFQQKYGNFTIPLFIALVLSYMLKDRIKDLMRYYFAHKLSSKFFDHKIRISIRNRKIGWIKEGFDFIAENKTPAKVIELRNRSSLLKAENRYMSEKIILYRERVRLDRIEVNKVSEYAIPGINDIIRFNVSEFVRKMDNPEVPLMTSHEEKGYQVVEGEKIYYLNFIIQCRYEEQTQYKRYRVCLNKLGIKKMDTL
ncbi:MAG: hypothetical protein RR202_03025 [Bacteroidales bacterium]